MRNLASRLTVLVVIALVALPAAEGLARTGFVSYVDGPSGTNVRMTLHFNGIVSFTTKCRIGSVFEGAYTTPASFKHLKINRAHRFYARLTMKFAGYNSTTHETEESSVPVTLAAHFVTGHAFLRGTITNSHCDGGKPLAFKTAFSGYEF